MNESKPSKPTPLHGIMLLGINMVLQSTREKGDKQNSITCKQYSEYIVLNDTRPDYI